MRIRKLQLKNGYKRFHDLTIDLGDKPARLVALVGPNGCGKSSVLDGLLFHHGAHFDIGSTGRKGYEYHSMTRDPAFRPESVSIEFDSGTYTDVRKRKQLANKGNTIFSFRSPYRYNSNLMVKSSKALPGIETNRHGATSAIDIDDRMEGNYLRLNAKYNRYLHESDCRPSEARAKIIGELNTSIRNCLSLSISSIGDIESSRGTLYFKKPDHPNEFEFNVLSSGEKEVIDLLLDLYLRRDEYDETIFLIDEPELHISTKIQARLLEEIDRLVGPNSQIWITTHSIGFMRAIQDKFRNSCQVIHIRGEYELASRSYELTPVPLSSITWRDLFGIAIDDLSKLVCPKRLIYCEGKAEPGIGFTERGFDAKVYNKIFSSHYTDTLFISSGGNTELDQRSEIAIEIIGKALPDLEILVLKDRDMASGKITTEADRAVYLKTNPSFHRLLTRWEIENYLFDKEILNLYCSANSLQFDEAAYDSFVKDVSNQNLKDDTGRIKKACGISGSINSEHFKLSLAANFTPDTNAYKELEICIFGRQES